MATYTLKGSRFIRRYDAPVRTPVYSAASDAAQIAADICHCPWVEIGTAASVFPSHNDNALDANLETRDLFDAANFCTGHSDGMHLAHANVACYKFALPSAAVGLTLTSLRASISCDPYCRDGARVAINTNSTGVIPTACEDCRVGLAHAEGVAPRTVSADGRTWFGATADATITPSDAITLGSYLYVFITLETPSYSRDAWLEGAAKAINSFEVTFSAAIAGIADGSTIDCSIPPMSKSLTVSSGTHLCAPAVGEHLIGGICNYSFAGKRYEGTAPSNQIGGSSRDAYKHVVNVAYCDIMSSKVISAVEETQDNNHYSQHGCIFEIHVDIDEQSVNNKSFSCHIQIPRIKISLPSTFKPRAIRFTNMHYENGGGPNFYIFDGCHIGVWIGVGRISEDSVIAFASNPSILDCRDDVVEGFRLVGKFTADDNGFDSKDFPLPDIVDEREAVVFLVPFVPIESAISNLQFACAGSDESEGWTPEEVILLG